MCLVTKEAYAIVWVNNTFKNKRQDTSVTRNNAIIIIIIIINI